MSFAVKNLSKTYGGVTVLGGVDLAVEDGEIHALLGANGAGKSTLIKCVGGAIRPDSGTITIDGETHTGLAPREARVAGVAVIYQEFSLAQSLSVAENVFLGCELRVGPFIRKRKQIEETRVLLASLDAGIEPEDGVDSLVGAGPQLVEIIKALVRDPRLLILDEPTSSLTESEATLLNARLRALKRHGIPILYVTHRLGEVFELADRVTVLSGGRVVLSKDVKEVSRTDLVDAIVGRAYGGAEEASRTRSRQSEARRSRSPALRIRRLVAPGVGPLDLDVLPGEIMGVYGLLGSGRTELVETLAGGQLPASGSIELESAPVRFRAPHQAIAAGIALVPSDRVRKSLFPPLSSLDNLLLPSLTRLSRTGIRQRNAERARFSRVAASLHLQPPRYDMRADSFSGGNQQKLTLGRWLAPEQGVKVLLLDEPTQGVDVGARAELYAALKEMVSDGGRAAIVTSSEPEELIHLADRIVVLAGGRLAGLIERSEFSERRLVALAHTGEAEA